MKVANGVIKAYAKPTGQEIASWPVHITKGINAYALEYPILSDTQDLRFPTIPDAASELDSHGNDWVRLEVFWSE